MGPLHDGFSTSNDDSECEKIYSLFVLMFGGIYRYKDVIRLRWCNLQLGEGGEFKDLSFERRKNTHLGQGNTVTVSAIPQGWYVRFGFVVNYKKLWDQTA
jgi:hypothetical protein